MMFASSRHPAPACGDRRHDDNGDYSDYDGEDALALPADAGLALLRRRAVRTGPVAYDPAEGLVQLVVPEGSAEALPGLLDWLEWGGISLDLSGRTACHPREAAVWLRPPGPGYEVSRVDLVRLVSAAATECHSARLRRATGPCGRTGRSPGTSQPLAFS